MTGFITGFTTLLAAMFLLPLCAQSEIDVQQQSVKKVEMYNYLCEAGARLGCYFTVERNAEEEQSAFAPNLYMRNSKPVSSVTALIAKLNKEFPGISVVQDEQNPKIIHLMDASLEKISQYPMDQKTSIAYSGPLLNLPNAIGRQTHLTVAKEYVYLTPAPSLDYATQVKVAAKNQTVRSILSTYVPLQHYNRFLWTASVRMYEGKPYTWVEYYGPAPVKATVPEKPENTAPKT